MNIRLKDYLITSDRYQFILNKVGVYKKGDHIGEEFVKSIGYYPSLEMLINSLITLEIRRSDIRTLKEIKTQISVLREWIKQELS